MASGSLTGSLRETLAVFEESGVPLTTPEVADQLDLGRRSIYNRLEQLAEQGRLETKKVGANARVWWRPPTNATARTPDWPAAAESLIDDVLDGAEVGVFVLDENFEVVWINAATERYFGLEREHVLGRDKRQLIDERIMTVVDDSETFAETVLSTYDDNTYTEHFECHVRSGDSCEERWLEHRSKPIESGAYADGRVELYYDVTDRKRSEHSLRHERNLIDQIFETVPAGIGVLSTTGEIVRANEWAEELLGVTETDPDEYDARERQIYDGKGNPIPPDERPYGQVLETGEPVLDWQCQIEHPNGNRRWLSISAAPLRETKDEPDQIVVAGEDITQFKEQTRRLERQRDELESELKDVFDRVSDAFYGLDSNLRFNYVNDHAAELLDLSKPDVIGSYVGAELDLTDAFERSLVEAVEEGRSVALEDYYDPLGAWFDVAIYPSETGVSVYFRDVTERKQRERELSQYETLFEESKDVNVIVEPDGTFRYLTPSASSVFGYDPEELVGEVGFEFIHPDDREEALTKFAKMIESPGYEPQVEFRFEHKDGSWIVLEALVRDLRDDPDVEGLVIYTRDVTERKERERAIEESQRQYRTLVENFPNGAVILFDEDLQYLIAGGEAFEGLEVSIEDLEGETIPEHLPAEFVDTFEPRFRAVFEGQASEFEFEFDDQIRQFQIVPVRDESGSVFAGLTISQDVTPYREHERELKRQREQLAALNSLNDVVRDITEAVIDQSTREEIEATVCERLAESGSYEFAWIAEVNPQTMALDPHVEAGIDGYLEEVPTSMDPDEPSGQGPGGKAIRTREIQVTQDAMTDPDFEPWREHAKQYGYRSAAAIPIVHDETLYGLLGVYADRPKAFECQEQEVIGQLGEVVGHAIAAIKRKQALTSDEITEIEFTIPDVAEFAGIEMEIDGTISFDRAVSTGDGTYLEYGTVDVSATDALEALVDQVSYFEEVTIVDREADTARFELRLSEPPVVSVVASHGGYLQQAAIENGDFHLTIHLPVTVEARRIIDAVQDAYPTADLLRRRQITRSDDTLTRVHQTVARDLTDRQRATLEAAYHAGFFEWPRDATGEEVAESLGIAPSTFSQHLRKGQQQVFGSLFSTGTPA